MKFVFGVGGICKNIYIYFFVLFIFFCFFCMFMICCLVVASLSKLTGEAIEIADLWVLDYFRIRKPWLFPREGLITKNWTRKFN